MTTPTYVTDPITSNSGIMSNQCVYHQSGNDYFVKRVDLVKRDITIRTIRVSGSEISGCWRGAIGLAASEGEEAGGCVVLSG